MTKQKECTIVLGLHMILCYYALGERDKMKRGFQMLLECLLNIDDDEKYNAVSVSIPYIQLLVF
jgi:intraflagellar transport protein 88